MVNSLSKENEPKQEQIVIPKELQEEVNEYILRKNSFNVSVRDYHIQGEKLVTILLKYIDALTKEITKIKTEKEQPKEDKKKTNEKHGDSIG